MSWELYGTEKIQLYGWDWDFQKFLTTIFWVSWEMLFKSNFVFRQVVSAVSFDWFHYDYGQLKKTLDLNNYLCLEIFWLGSSM